MAKKGRTSVGGPVKSIFAAVWLLMLAGTILGFARANDLTSPEAVIDYARSWSDKTDECVGDGTEFRCGPNYNPGGGTDPAPTPDEDLPPATIKALSSKLEKLPKGEAVEVDYDRGEWAHWTDPEGNGCDSREDVLIRQGKNVKTEPDDPCDVASGVWVSPYEGLEITNSSSIDIDHVIPLGWAAKHGGQEWSEDRKETFANDFTQLLATSASTNRSKSDRGPSEYMPERKEYWCTYGRIWIDTASKYSLTMPEADRKVLREAIKSC